MLDTRSKYLQIAFNRTLDEVMYMISLLPVSDKIIIEAGTPLIKRYGSAAISTIKESFDTLLGKPGYIVADLKCIDRGTTEVLAAYCHTLLNTGHC